MEDSARGLGLFNPSLCACFAELSSLLPCPTVEVSLNNKAEKGEFASSLLLLLNWAPFPWGEFWSVGLTVRVLRCSLPVLLKESSDFILRCDAVDVPIFRGEADVVT